MEKAAGEEGGPKGGPIGSGPAFTRLAWLGTATACPR